MVDYSLDERLTKYTDSDMDLILKINELKEKSRGDDSQSLELMCALECKRRYESLKEDCTADQFIYSAHKTAMAIKTWPRRCPQTQATGSCLQASPKGKPDSSHT